MWAPAFLVCRTREEEPQVRRFQKEKRRYFLNVWFHAPHAPVERVSPEYEGAKGYRPRDRKGRPPPPGRTPFSAEYRSGARTVPRRA